MTMLYWWLFYLTLFFFGPLTHFYIVLRWHQRHSRKLDYEHYMHAVFGALVWPLSLPAFFLWQVAVRPTKEEKAKIDNEKIREQEIAAGILVKVGESRYYPYSPIYKYKWELENGRGTRSH